MKEVVVTGGYGHGDIGDESQLTASLINLEKLVPDIHLLALSDNPENTRKYHKVESEGSINTYLFAKPRIGRRFSWLVIPLRIFSLLFNARRLGRNKNPIFLNAKGKKFLENLRNADLLYNVGGGNLSSKWRIGGLYCKCLTYILCRTFRTPIVLSGQTIGPFSNRLDRFLAKFALNRVNIITLRENLSRAVLDNIGVTKPIIIVTADDATLLPIEHNKVEEAFSQEKIEQHHPLIAMNMIELGILPEAKKRKARKLLAEIADYLITEHDAKIIFVPMSYQVGKDDRSAASEVLKLMKHADKAHVITHEYDDPTLKGIIGRTDLAIGLRYHFIVFAVNSQVPTIGIYLDDYYAIKVKGALELVNQKKYACDIAKTSLQDSINLIEDITSNIENVRRKLEQRTKQLERLSLLSTKYAAKLLTKG